VVGAGAELAGAELDDEGGELDGGCELDERPDDEPGPVFEF
jgi:hypothetical protein